MVGNPDQWLNVLENHYLTVRALFQRPSIWCEANPIWRTVSYGAIIFLLPNYSKISEILKSDYGEHICAVDSGVLCQLGSHCYAGRYIAPSMRVMFCLHRWLAKYPQQQNWFKEINKMMCSLLTHSGYGGIEHMKIDSTKQGTLIHLFLRHICF